MSVVPSTSKQALIQMAGGFNISQLIYVTAKLGLADLIKDEPKTLGELVDGTGTSTSGLYRLLRGLLVLGILTQDAGNRYGLTELGDYLRADHPASARPHILFLTGEVNWQAWGDLSYSVKTGASAFQHQFGMELFEYINYNPQFGEIFNNAMASMTGNMVVELVSGYDFSQFKRVVDVGGGNGALLTALLKAYPSVLGTLFDLPGATNQAIQLLEDAGLSERCTVIGGDFFESVPAGGDVYILKSILHDWDDPRAFEILKNCCKAMGNKARLLVVEGLIAEKIEPTAAQLVQVIYDLRMLVMTPGGKERTETEFRQLFKNAGLELSRVISIGPWKIIEGVKE